MDKLNIFFSLCNVFEEHGFSLYMVGGTVRDYLLGYELEDMDVVSDATPDDMKLFLTNAFYDFAKFGSVKLIYKDVKFDITTLREEKSYSDSRHPKEIKFIKDLSLDSNRRDFSINAMYMDKNLKIYDFHNGQKDLTNKVIKMIGSSDERIKEDPLRIIRALRFSLLTSFNLDTSLVNSIKQNIELLSKLNPMKINEDIRKIKCDDKNKIIQIFDYFGLTKYLNVID